MRKLVIATGNLKKLKEISELLRDYEYEIISVKELGLSEFNVIEDGETLAENALIKARALKKLTDFAVIADDSGLFVNELGGEPGVHSARYAGEGHDDLLNNKKLIDELKKKKDRSAEFRACIAYIDESGNEKVLEGVCKGSIILEPRGQNGFGYDPLFIPKGYNETFAELSSEEKNKISHRSKALIKLRTVLEKEL